MALTVDETNWAEEIRAAEQYRDDICKSVRSHLVRYAPTFSGTFVGESGYTENHDPENHILELVTTYMPELVMTNPRVKVTSPRVDGDSKNRAEGLTNAGNRWIRDTDLKRHVEKVGVDFLFRHGVTLISRSKNPKELFDNEDSPMWPVVKRIPMDEFLVDSKAKEASLARFMGHPVERDYDDVLQHAEDHPEEGWDVEAIKRMGPGGGGDPSHERNRVSRQSYAPDRDEVTYYELYVPEIELEDHEDYDPRIHHGAWLTVALVADSSDADQARSGVFIREPQPARCPRWGPYEWTSGLVVPNEAFGLSLVSATDQQREDLNKHARSVARSAARYKRFVAVNDGDSDLQAKIEGSEHDYVIPVNTEDVGRNVVPVEVGGITEQQITYLQLAQDRLDRVSGMSDAVRGAVTGDGTATENAIANERASAAMAFMAGKMRDHVLGVLRTVLWYLDTEDGLEIEIGLEGMGDVARVDADIQSAKFVGGDGLAEGNKPIDVDNFDFELDLFSMGRVPDQVEQMRAQTYMQVVQMAATLGPQTALFMPWGEVLSQLAELYNMPQIKKILDTDALHNFAQMMLQQQLAPPQAGGGSEAQPRLSRDQTKPGPINVTDRSSRGPQGFLPGGANGNGSTNGAKPPAGPPGSGQGA